MGQNARVTTDPPFEAYRGGEPYAFVSYAHADSHLVYPLVADLHERGYRIWYDEGIEPTDSWPETLADKISGCQLYVLFVTRVSVERDGIELEIEWAHTHGKRCLAVCLEETRFPPSVGFFTEHRQFLTYRRRDHDEWITEIRKVLDRPEYTLQGEPLARGGPECGPNRDPGKRPPKAPQQTVPKSVSELFVDRVGESDALIRSVARQLRRLSGAEELEPGVYPTVLVFHGGGGVGKSGLSERLETWVRGGLSGTAEWGTWPHPHVISVRWDFHESVGNLDLTRLLHALRAALADSDNACYAFDVALAAYLEAVGGTARGVLGGEAADGVLRSLQVVAAQLKMSPPTSLTSEDIRRVAGRVRASADRPSPYALSGNHDLVDVLDRIRRLHSGMHAPEVVAEILYLLTLDIWEIEPARRPALVFFLDHFENIQRGESAIADAAIASFVAQLPYALFVITGRDRINWADPARTGLHLAGPAVWPGLVLGSLEEPRQHMLRRLSDEDTRRLYEHHRNINGWEMADGLVDALVSRSAGLPLHIGAVLQLAATTVRQNPGTVLTAEQLDRELPDVVGRLLRTLTAAEAKAFRAACVLPSFDPELAAAVGQVDSGDVERAIRFALVESSNSPVYPYRVHDDIRRLVRLDRDSHGYWSESDWLNAARRGMDEAIRRIRDGHEQGSDEQQLQGIALAIRLGYEWDTYVPGLADLVYDGPSMAALAPLIPSVEALTKVGDIGALIEFIHSMPKMTSKSLELLQAIRTDNSEVAFRVDSWTVMRLRTLRRYDEAITLSANLLDKYPDQQGYLWHQYAITLQIGRHFRDAIASKADHDPEGLPHLRLPIDRAHGIGDHDPALRERYIRSKSSRRLREELAIAELIAEAHFTGIDVEDTERRIAEQIARGTSRTNTRKLLRILGYAFVTDTLRFDGVLARIEEIGTTERRGLGMSYLLTLRALFTLDPADIEAAVAAVDPQRSRGMAYIPVEVWLEELGQTLPTRETQWLIPYEQVRENWLRIADGMLERSKQYVAELDCADQPVRG